MFNQSVIRALVCCSLFLVFGPSSVGQAFRFNRADFALGTNPGGIASGDFNGDGRLDLAVTDYISSTVTILLGKKDGTFLQHASYATGYFPGSVVTADFNGDGKPDIAVANWLASTVAVYLGNGDGNFGTPTTSSVGGYASLMAVADFNKDGKLDIAVTNNTTNLISVLMGLGNGSFAPYVGYAAPSTTIGIVAADLNADGNVDLAVADTWGNDVFILLGKADGSFQPGTSFAAGQVPVELVAGDFNGDGFLDLVVVDGPDCGCAYMSVLLGNGDGTFQAPNTISIEVNPSPILMGDFNHDHKLDVVIGENGLVSIFLGNGDGTFKPNVDYGSDGAPGALASGDFNRDGKIDLAIANFNGNNATHVSTLLGNGDGTFGRTSSYGTGQHPVGVVNADFNGDGNSDLATVNTYDSTVSVLLGRGRGKFGAAVNYSVNIDYQYGAIVSADFNGDGHPDLATINFSAGTVSILLNQGNGTFGAYKDFPAGPLPQSLVAGDFNNDQKMDLVVGNLGADASLLLGNGSGGFQAPITIASGLGPYAMAVADFNGDGNLDLAAVNGSQSSNSVWILLGAGNGTFATAVAYSTGSGPAAVVAADLYKDGKVDLAVLTTFIAGVSVLLGNGDGTFQNYSSYPVPNYSFGLLAADFSGQNNLDLAVLNQASSYDVELLAGDGKGQFSSATPYYPGIGPASFVADDFDKNGSMDLAVTNAIYLTSSVTVLLNTAVAALSANTLKFPPTAVGTQSQPVKVQFSNPGTVSVKIRSISISGANAGDFVEASTCGTKVAVGASCTVTVTFRPSQIGKRSALLKFTDNAIGGTQVVTLAGTGR